MTRLPAFLALMALAPLSAEAASLRIDFTGTANEFNIGPFGSASAVAASFFIDLDTPDTGGAIPTFVGALQDLMLDVGASSFTGDDGKLDIVDIPGSQIAVRGFFGSGDGMVSGSVPDSPEDFLLESIYLEARFDETLLLGDLTTLTVDDFGFLRLVLDFTHPTASLVERQLIMTTGEFDAVSVSVPTAVPLPAAAWLFAGSLAALTRLRQRAGSITA